MTTTFTLTGNFADLLGVDLPGSKIVASLGTNLGTVALVDLDANKVYPPKPVRLAVADDGTFSVTLIATNSTGTNISDGSLRYIVRAEIPDGRRGKITWDSGYFELTADIDLSDVVGSDVAIPVTPLPSPALLDAATAANVGDSGSQTGAALNGKFVGQGGSTGLVLDVLTGSGAAVGNEVADDTAALQAKVDAAAAWGGTVLFGKHRITASITAPAGVTIRGRNDSSRLLLPADATFPAIIVDGASRVRVENLRVSAAGAVASGATAVLVRGNATDVTLTNISAESMWDGFRAEGAEVSAGTIQRLTLSNCLATNSGQYGYRFGDVNGVDLVACRSVGSALDAVKLRKTVHNWTVTGGLFTGADGGDGLDAYAGGGDFTINGAVFSSNTLNGIVIKCDDLNLSDPANYGWVRNGNIANVQASNNGGSGLTIHRNNGDVDDTAEPLVQSITVTGGIYNNNVNYGVFINARQVSVFGAQAKRNGLDGIRVQSAARDVDLVACHVAGNSQTSSGTRDGIYIAGKRVKVWGGSSTGSDPDGATNDADVAAGTKTQRYGLRIEAASTGCVVAGLSLLNNITGNMSDLSIDTVLIYNPTDVASAPAFVMPNNQRLFGRKADGSQLSVAYVTTGGGINYGDATAGLAILGASATVFPRLDTSASTTSRASLRIPHGDAPTSPANGDMWTTTAGLFIRINGTTVGPLT